MNSRIVVWLGLGCAWMSAAPALGANVVPSHPADLRIAIIGAGASGLTAAHRLKQLGYTNIVLYEREAAVGGKVSTFMAQGVPYEMGAVWLLPDYKTVRALAEEHGVEITAARSIDIHYRGKTYGILDYVLTFHPVDFIPAVIRFGLTLAGYPAHNSPGFSGAPWDWRRPFTDFARLHHIDPIGDSMASLLTGCGYGYYDDVPAMYYMKLMPWIMNPQGIIQNPQALLLSFKAGWQELWRAVARDQDVRLNSEVTRVVRSSDRAGNPRITVWANGQSEVFDRILVSAPPDRLIEFMDLSAQERRLFGEVRTYRYLVTVMEGANLPHAVLHDHITPDTMGHLTAVGQFYPDRNIYSFYQLLPDDMTLDQAMARLRADVLALGGTATKVLAQKLWSYFPHVKTPALQEGFYEELERLQGSRGTYYVGGLMNFETVEHTALYAKSLVEAQFGSPCSLLAWLLGLCR